MGQYHSKSKRKDDNMKEDTKCSNEPKEKIQKRNDNETASEDENNDIPTSGQNGIYKEITNQGNGFDSDSKMGDNNLINANSSGAQKTTGEHIVNSDGQSDDVNTNGSSARECNSVGGTEVEEVAAEQDSSNFENVDDLAEGNLQEVSENENDSEVDVKVTSDMISEVRSMIENCKLRPKANLVAVQNYCRHIIHLIVNGDSSGVKKLIDAVLEELRCSVCYVVLIEPVCLNDCLHNFCNECVQEWVCNNKPCPLCKKIPTDIESNNFLNYLITKLVQYLPEHIIKEIEEVKQQRAA